VTETGFSSFLATCWKINLTENLHCYFCVCSDSLWTHLCKEEHTEARRYFKLL